VGFDGAAADHNFELDVSGPSGSQGDVPAGSEVPSSVDIGARSGSSDPNIRSGVQACLNGQLPANVDPITGQDFCAMIDKFNNDLSNGSR
jgi:hypothetical protein